jgi:hypothetical protein
MAYRPALGEICLATSRTSPPWPCIIVDPRRSTTPASVSRDRRSRSADRVVVLFYETQKGLYDFPLLSSIIAYSSEPAVKSRMATVEKLRRLGTPSSAKRLEEFVAACEEADADMLVPREERELVFVSDDEDEEGSSDDDDEDGDDDDDDDAVMKEAGAVDDDEAQLESSVAADDSRGVAGGSRESAASAGAGAGASAGAGAGASRAKRPRVESSSDGGGGAGGLPARNVEQQRMGRLDGDGGGGGSGSGGVRARAGALQLEVVGASTPTSNAADTADALELRAALASGFERSDARALLSALTGPLCTRINLTFSILTETKLAEELKKLLKCGRAALCSSARGASRDCCANRPPPLRPAPAPAPALALRQISRCRRVCGGCRSARRC